MIVPWTLLRHKYPPGSDRCNHTTSVPLVREPGAIAAQPSRSAMAEKLASGILTIRQPLDRGYEISQAHDLV